MPDKLVTIQMFDNPHRADFAKMLLDQHEIPCVLQNRGIIEMDWLLSNAIGNIQLKVAPEDVELATTLLAENQQEREQVAAAQQASATGLCCLDCGQDMPEHDDTCPACGWSYADTPPG